MDRRHVDPTKAYGHVAFNNNIVRTTAEASLAARPHEPTRCRQHQLDESVDAVCNGRRRQAPPFSCAQSIGAIDQASRVNDNRTAGGLRGKKPLKTRGFVASMRRG